MNSAKGTLLKNITLLICAACIISCHSNKVVSSYGKRKYTKGWFWFKHKTIDTKAAKGKDTTLTHTYHSPNNPSKKNAVSGSPPSTVNSGWPEKTKHHKKEKVQQQPTNPTVVITPKKEKDKTKPPPEPPDHVMMRLLVFVIVLAGVAIFITGLVTPILIWQIAQNFLIVAGIAITLFGWFLSVNANLGVNQQDNGTPKPYNIGKPAWILSLWAILPIAFLKIVLITSHTPSPLLLQIGTIGLFFAGACILLSIIFAIKALFVNDRHKGKAVFALFIDALLITAGLLFFL